MTVLESIEEDAVEYRFNGPELYADALSFYAQSSSLDTHASDVLELVRRIGDEDVSELQKRAKHEVSRAAQPILFPLVIRPGPARSVPQPRSKPKLTVQVGQHDRDCLAPTMIGSF